MPAKGPVISLTLLLQPPLQCPAMRVHTMCRFAHQTDATNAPDGILTIHSKSEGAAQIGAMAKMGSTQKVGGAGFKLLCVARRLATAFCLTMVSPAPVVLRLRP